MRSSTHEKPGKAKILKFKTWKLGKSPTCEREKEQIESSLTSVTMLGRISAVLYDFVWKEVPNFVLLSCSFEDSTLVLPRIGSAILRWSWSIVFRALYSVEPTNFEPLEITLRAWACLYWAQWAPEMTTFQAHGPRPTIHVLNNAYYEGHENKSIQKLPMTKLGSLENWNRKP